MIKLSYGYLVLYKKGCQATLGIIEHHGVGAETVNSVVEVDWLALQTWVTCYLRRTYDLPFGLVAYGFRSWPFL